MQRLPGGSGLDDVARLRRHGHEPRLHRRRVGLPQQRQVAAHDLEGDGRAQEADGRAHAGTRGHEHAPDAQLLRQAPRVQRRGAAEGDHRVLLGRAAALDRVHARGVGHVLLDDLAHAGRSPEGVHAERGADADLQRLRGAGWIQRQAAGGEARRVDAAEHEVGVGHRRQRAAAAVAGRAGLGAAGIGADGDAAHRVHAPDRAAAGADLDELDHRHAHRQAAALEVAPGARHLEAARALGLAVLDEADLGRGAAHVEGEHVAQPALARQVRGQDGAARGPRLDEPDREARRLLQRRQPAAGHHQQQRASQPALARAFAQALQVAAHQRSHAGVGHGGREALVLAHLGADLARQADGDALAQQRLQQLARALLVRRVRPGMQEAHRDGLDPGGAHRQPGAAHALLVQRAQHRAVGGDTLAHRVAQRARHQHRGGLDVDVVGVAALLVAHLEHVAEALGGQQRGARALALDQRVGRERGAVDEQPHLAGAHAGLGQQALHPFQHRELGRARRRQHLAGVAARGRLEDDVGEGAADVGGQAHRGARALAHTEDPW